MGNTTRRAADRISSPAWELEYACLSVQGQRKAQEDRFDVRCERVTLPSEPTAAAEPTPPLSGPRPHCPSPRLPLIFTLKS